MALDGQVSYLSREYPGVLPRTRTPRRSPAIRINQEDEEDRNDGRTSPNLGMKAPIIGFEVVDERRKFTVYKIEVKSQGKSWFVFRRYSDFIRLNDRLKDAYPNFHIRLPGKRWFKDNFNPEFIEERAKGLQFFINNVMNHGQICQSSEVEQFFCIDDPPGPYDSLEESRAYCQHLESEVDDLKRKVEELQAELKMTKSQLVQARVQQEALVSSLRMERTLRKKGTTTGSKRNSAEVEKLLENSENMADVDGLRGKVYELMSKPRSKSVSKMAPLNGNETEADKMLWNGRVDITEQSSGASRMMPSKLIRRQSQGKRSPLTSTPVSNSDRDSPKYHVSQLAEAKNKLTDNSKTLGIHEDFNTASTVSTSAFVKDTTERHNHYQAGNSKDSANEEPKTNTCTNKRDSGISVDTSPTPST